MEQMTKRKLKGNGYYMKCSEKCPHDCQETCDCEEFDKFVDLLAAYEKTGLEPQEIERIVDAYGRGLSLRTESAQRLELVREIKTDRLRELSEAERDGRCEIHKVKDGETVYSIFAYVNGLTPKKSNGKPFEVIAKYKVDDFTRNTVDREFGKTVFLTREEAEAGLKGEYDAVH